MNNQLIQFIKPGEFTFCSRCGMIARWGNKNFMCEKCRFNLFPIEKVSNQQFEETLLKQRYEKIVSNNIEQHREQLAILRCKFNDWTN